MAVIKANYVKRGKGEKQRAKATIRYFQHRPGKDKERVRRTLFGVDGTLDRLEVYQMIDEAQKRTFLYRIIISPDPKKEDALKDLHLLEITLKTMEALEDRLREKFGLREGLPWVAVEHDHTDTRHIHTLVLVPGKLSKADFQALRQAATTLALAQRRERDLARGYESQQRSRGSTLRASSVAYHPPWEPHAKPLPTTRPCYRCGEEQPVSRTEEHRCSSCGATLSRYGPGNEEKGAHWG